jgi:hypothetical protein
MAEITGLLSGLCKCAAQELACKYRIRPLDDKEAAVIEEMAVVIQAVFDKADVRIEAQLTDARSVKWPTSLTP